MSDFTSRLLERLRRGPDARVDRRLRRAALRRSGAASAPSPQRPGDPTPPATCGTRTSPSTTIRCRAGGCGSSTSRSCSRFVYLALYPGLGKLPGVLGWTSVGAYASGAQGVRRGASRRSTRSTSAWTSQAIAAGSRGAGDRRAAVPQPLRAMPRLRRRRQQRLSRTCATATGSTAASPRRSTTTHPRRPQRRDAAVRRGARASKASTTSSHYVRSLSGLPARLAARRSSASRCSRPTARPATAATARATPRSARPTSPTASGSTAARPPASPRPSIKGRGVHAAPSRACPRTRTCSTTARSSSSRPTCGGCPTAARQAVTRVARRRASRVVTERHRHEHARREVDPDRSGDGRRRALRDPQEDLSARRARRVRALALGAWCSPRRSSSTACRGSRGTAARRCCSTSARASSTSSASSSGRRT